MLKYKINHIRIKNELFYGKEFLEFLQDLNICRTNNPKISFKSQHISNIINNKIVKDT